MTGNSARELRGGADRPSLVSPDSRRFREAAHSFSSGGFERPPGGGAATERPGLATESGGVEFAARRALRPTALLSHGAPPY